MSGTPHCALAAASTPTPSARSARRHMGRAKLGPPPCAAVTVVTKPIAASATSLRPPAIALSTTIMSSSQPYARGRSLPLKSLPSEDSLGMARHLQAC
jgi:hypothetical protein